ncbi:hypothetical protein A2U01_0099553, partial [Trifolium medium]|nr:hypothetical protein [Trifolium medium]
KFWSSLRKDGENWSPQTTPLKSRDEQLMLIIPVAGRYSMWRHYDR